MVPYFIFKLWWFHLNCYSAKTLTLLLSFFVNLIWKKCWMKHYDVLAKPFELLQWGEFFLFFIYYYLKGIVNKTTVYCNGQTTY